MSACAPAIPHLSEGQLAWAEARWPGATVEKLERGRSLYVSRCSACHDAPAPGFDPQTQIGEMAERAKLKPEEQELVIQFLEAARTPAADRALSQGERPPGNGG